MKHLYQVAWVVVAVGAIGSAASAQEPTRARSQIVIPVKKNTSETPAPAPVARVVPGAKREVIAQPVVVHLIRTEAGTPTMLAERAPTVGGPSIPWIPLFGLLGGALLLHNLDHGSSGTPSTPPPSQPPPETPPPVTPPPTPPPPTPPPTTVPEPATLLLVATGLAGLALVRRRS